MNALIRKFFSESSFKEVLFLNEEPKMKWEDAIRLAPDLPRGWFELSHISPRDRIDFSRDYWLDYLPYHPSAHPQIFEFFEELDDIAVVLYADRAELIYSLQNNVSFFRGRPPCKEEDIYELKNEMKINLPRDFLAFARIHNGFGKLSEMGLLEIQDIAQTRRRVINLLIQTDNRVKSGNMDVDPGSLIPFYEALGLSSFQCFYTDWYPGSEMGNVYLSGIDYTLSDISDKKAWLENLAFPTFSEWLAQYLQGMSLCI